MSKQQYRWETPLGEWSDWKDLPSDHEFFAEQTYQFRNKPLQLWRSTTTGTSTVHGEEEA